MKKSILLSLVPLMTGVSLAGTAPSLSQVEVPTAEAGDWTQAVKDAMVVYQSDEGWVRKVYGQAIVQFQIADVQPSGPNGDSFKAGAGPVNQEFRRVWFGATMSTATDTTFHAYWKLGGFPAKSSYSNGQTNKNYTYGGLFDIWVKQSIHGVDGLSVKAGKIKTLFTDDYITPNTKIKTIERSLISNQYGLESNWGVELRYDMSKQNMLYMQLLANDRASYSRSLTHSDYYGDGDGLKGEFGWEDRCFAIIGGSHKFAQTEEGGQTLSFQYAHDFNNIYDGKRDAGSNCVAMSVKDALSLGHRWQEGKLSVETALIANFEQYKAKDTGNGNNIGLSIMPVYALNPHVDLVFRYTVMSGDGACNIGADRFICQQTTTDKYVDSVNAFYLGANFYYSAKNPDAAKIMTGLEYTTAREDGEGCYSGWTLMSAIRFAF
ncbi:MAG: porin [Akkermansia sp.]